MLEPHFCIHCNRPCLKQDLCKKCTTQLPWVTHLPTLKTPEINEIQSLFAHEEPISYWIHQFKYRNHLQLTRLFAQLMLKHLNIPPNTEQIIAIPLHTQRLKERGYNQAELIAKKIAKHTKISYQPNLMIRHKKTESQIQLNANQRQKNVKNCFRLNPETELSKQHILIIDDVYTTGATLNEAAKTLKKSAVETQITVWTIARAS
jgi:ComF family protein